MEPHLLDRHIARLREQSASEATLVADHLEALKEEGASRELILASLNELIEWAQAAQLVLK